MSHKMQLFIVYESLFDFLFWKLERIFDLWILTGKVCRGEFNHKNMFRWLIEFPFSFRVEFLLIHSLWANFKDNKELLNGDKIRVTIAWCWWQTYKSTICRRPTVGLVRRVGLLSDGNLSAKVPRSNSIFITAIK